MVILEVARGKEKFPVIRKQQWQTVNEDCGKIIHEK